MLPAGGDRGGNHFSPLGFTSFEIQLFPPPFSVSLSVKRGFYIVKDTYSSYLTGFAFLFGRGVDLTNCLREEAGEEKVEEKRRIICLLGTNSCKHADAATRRGREGVLMRDRKKPRDLAIGASSVSVQFSLVLQRLGGGGGSLRSRLGGSKESAERDALLAGAEPARRLRVRPGYCPPAGRSLWRCPRSRRPLCGPRLPSRRPPATAPFTLRSAASLRRIAAVLPATPGAPCLTASTKRPQMPRFGEGLGSRYERAAPAFS